MEEQEIHGGLGERWYKTLYWKSLDICIKKELR